MPYDCYNVTVIWPRTQWRTPGHILVRTSNKPIMTRWILFWLQLQCRRDFTCRFQSTLITSLPALISKKKIQEMPVSEEKQLVFKLFRVYKSEQTLWTDKNSGRTVRDEKGIKTKAQVSMKNRDIKTNENKRSKKVRRLRSLTCTCKSIALNGCP